jgi:membrane protease YdiL (CAAX protease family)
MNFKYSDVIEELFIKPVIWLLPFLYILPKSKIKISDLGLTSRNLFPSLYLSIAIGVGFTFLGLIANIAKYGGINFNANLGTDAFGISLVVSFATSITEELVFRGYLLGVFLKRFTAPIIPTIVSTVLWTLVHLPISYYVWKMGPLQIVIFLFLTFIYGLGASMLYIRTKNIASSIFLHFLWEWPIILFR